MASGWKEVILHTTTELQKKKEDKSGYEESENIDLGYIKLSFLNIQLSLPLLLHHLPNERTHLFSILISAIHNWHTSECEHILHLSLESYSKWLRCAFYVPVNQYLSRLTSSC